MSDSIPWYDGPAWLMKAGGEEGWAEREWRGWERIRARFDEFGPFELEMTADGATLGTYGPQTFLVEVRDEPMPIYDALQRLVNEIASARREASG